MNKIAIITGGSRGIGRATALKFAKEGINSIITYNSNEDEAVKTVQEIEKIGAKSIALKLDVADRNSYMYFAQVVQGALKTNFGTDKFDILVNNAGIGLDAKFLETTEEDFDRMANIHYRSVYFLSQKLVPFIKEGGHIINVSTGTTRFTLPGYSLYASLKGAVETLTKFMAKELAPLKIRVNVIAPGATATDFRGGFVRDNKDVQAYLASLTTEGRVGLPDDIGDAIYGIISSDMHWLNGQRFEASGGQAI